MNESERQHLRTRIDAAKRDEIDDKGRARQALVARSTDEIKRQTAESKAMVAAACSTTATAERPTVVAQAGEHVFLIAVGGANGHVLDMRASPLVSGRSDVYTLLAGRADWTPFTGDPLPLVAAVRQLLEAETALTD